MTAPLDYQALVMLSRSATSQRAIPQPIPYAGDAAPVAQGTMRVGGMGGMGALMSSSLDHALAVAPAAQPAPTGVQMGGTTPTNVQDRPAAPPDRAKLYMGLAVGAVAVAGLLWWMNRRPRRNPHDEAYDNPDDEHGDNPVVTRRGKKVFVPARRRSRRRR